ncbi:MAG TPA: hypothetical protein VFH80_00875 [Solirubrobacteraceae bacterium]|nr:hypothetical protein [Solirubrobacteraceae bacterium]
MPVKSPAGGTPTTAADQTVGVQDPERTPGTKDPELPPPGKRATSEQDGSNSSRVPSPAERLVAERTERFHQRMLARESSVPTREPDGPERRKRATGSPSALTPPGRQTLRNWPSAAMIGMLAFGAALGAILGVLHVAGWLMGLLVAGLTAILATVATPRSRST